MKKSNLSTINVPDSLSGTVVFDYVVSSVEGRLLTFIEAMGLPQSQEKAAKDIVRQELWKVYQDSVYITGEQVQEIAERNRSMAQSLPLR